MGFEIPIDVNYFDHPKTMTLIGLIGPEADIYPLRLWRWASMYAKNGFVAGGRAQIEAAAKWKGNAGVLHRALMKAGFLEPDGKTIHDFMEGIGRAIALYENKKARQREKYASENLPPSRDAPEGSLPEENGRIPPTPSHPGNSETPHPENPRPAEVLFERFWAVFSRIRKTSKGAARKAFEAACRKKDAESIIAAADEYAQSPVGKGQFAKSPAAWLNQECWDDDRDAWNRSDNKKGASNAKPECGLYDPEADNPSAMPNAG